MLEKPKSSEFEQLVEREISLCKQRSAKARELSQAEDTARLALLGDAPIEETTAPVARLNAELAAIDLAIATCRARRPEAIRAAFTAEAERLKAEADAKGKELASLQAKTSKLLAALSDLEGVEYEEAILSVQPARAIGTGYAVPRSARLQTEISRLTRKASDLEGQDVPAAGGIDLDGVSDLREVIAAVLRERSVGPGAAAVSAWLEACEANAANSGFKRGDLMDRVYLRWEDGVIDPSSYVFVKALIRNDHPYGPIASATFRAEVR